MNLALWFAGLSVYTILIIAVCEAVYSVYKHKEYHRGYTDAIEELAEMEPKKRQQFMEAVMRYRGKK